MNSITSKDDKFWHSITRQIYQSAFGLATVWKFDCFVECVIAHRIAQLAIYRNRFIDNLYSNIRICIYRDYWVLQFACIYISYIYRSSIYDFKYRVLFDLSYLVYDSIGWLQPWPQTRRQQLRRRAGWHRVSFSHRRNAKPEVKMHFRHFFFL